MTIEETKIVLQILKTAYPYFYKNTGADELKQALLLWHEMFADDELEVVKYALKRLIETHESYPPTIAHLRQKIDEVTEAANGDPTDTELWALARKAIGNGYYGAEEEYNKLPPVAQRFFGSPRGIRQLAMAGQDVIETVTKGQFLKQLPVLKKREDEVKRMNPQIRETISRLAEKLMLKEEEDGPEEQRER